MNKLVFDLCSGTGSWSRPYADAGYTVVQVDISHGQSVHDFLEEVDEWPQPRGILAAPPCTEFAVSGARWWAVKPSHLLSEAVDVVRDCLQIIRKASPIWWALENPVGRIARCVPELGRPSLVFDPCDYGDPYTKKTQLFGRFVVPKTTAVPPQPKSPIHYMPPSADRARLRSITPPGFARAFFEANP